MASIATAAPGATAATEEQPSRAGRGVRITLFYLLLLVIAVVFITPYLFSVFAAFKPLTAILAAGQVTFSLLGAYAFARMEFPGRDALFWMYLATLMVPNVVTMVPLY